MRKWITNKLNESPAGCIYGYMHATLKLGQDSGVVAIYLHFGSDIFFCFCTREVALDIVHLCYVKNIRNLGSQIDCYMAHIRSWSR